MGHMYGFYQEVGQMSWLKRLVDVGDEKGT